MAFSKSAELIKRSQKLTVYKYKEVKNYFKSIQKTKAFSKTTIAQLEKLVKTLKEKT